MTRRPTALQRWRARRDRVIRVVYGAARRAGWDIDQRWLADVFDLPQSRVSAVVRGGSDRAKNPEPPAPQRPRARRAGEPGSRAAAKG